MLEENPFSTIFVQNTPTEEKKQEIYQDLMFRNVTNQTMIKNYYTKAEKKSLRKRSARSL